MADQDNIRSSILAPTVSAANDNGAPTNDQTKNEFWEYSDIDPTRFNRYFPYQLVVLRVDKEGKYALEKNWQFTLPIPPESLTISTPYAINVTATLGGIIEEHNGAPFRMINLSGSTGVFPLKGSAPALRSWNLAEGIFAGTIQSINRVASDLNNLVNNFSNGALATPPNVIQDSELEGQGGNASGYAQFRLLEQFLEKYVNIKRTKAGKDLRLAFVVNKDGYYYLVTPQSFNLARNAGSPFEYNYSLQLKAWRRVTGIGTQNAVDVFKPATRDPNSLARILKAISDSRQLISDTADSLRAVAGDISHSILEPARQSALFVKDLLGVPLTLADVPNAVIRDAKEAILTFASTKESLEGFTAPDGPLAEKGNKVQKEFGEMAGLGNNLLYPETQGVNSRQFGKNTGDNPADPANDLFLNKPNENFKLFNNIKVGDLQVAPQISAQISAARAEARAKDRSDWETYRDGMQDVLGQFSAAVGAGDATYDAQFGQVTVDVDRTPSDEDFDIMFSLNNLILAFNELAASGEVNQFKVDNINFVAGLASRSGIAFTVPTSKFSVPFPYGYTLERLSQVYLGDPDRWMEIATLNGLRSPFVDETGYDSLFLSNGNGNSITISDASRMFIGQAVSICSNTVHVTNRRITNIRTITSTLAVVSVDGDPDLEDYTTDDAAFVHAFLPDTVNSQMMIYIPSLSPPGQEDHQTKAIPGLDVYQYLFDVGGVDLLLTQDNDLVITPDGDQRLAVGLTNIIQMARIALSVVQGTLSHHPSFGIPIQVGQSLADTNIKELFGAVKNLFQGNPIFTEVRGIRITNTGPVSAISLSVGISGYSDFVPLTFELP